METVVTAEAFQNVLPEASRDAAFGSYERWLHYASNCIGYTTEGSGHEVWAEYCRKVARFCAEQSARGESTCIFHGCAAVSGTKCQCSKCRVH